MTDDDYEESCECKSCQNEMAQRRIRELEAVVERLTAEKTHWMEVAFKWQERYGGTESDPA